MTDEKLREVGRFCISRGSSEFFFRDKKGAKGRGGGREGISLREKEEGPRHATVHSSPTRKPTRSSSSAAEN
jgi:hypothetical protein